MKRNNNNKWECYLNACYLTTTTKSIVIKLLKRNTILEQKIIKIK